MDEIISRDQNTVTVLAAVTDDATQNISQLLVDPVTDRLLIEVVDSASVSSLGESIAKRDQNFTTVLLGYDDDNNPIEVTTDENGYLLVDILSE